MDHFDKFSAFLRASLAQALLWGDGHLYATNKTDLDQVYLSGFANPADRQYHNCSACRSFLRRYGGLAVISKDGTQVRSAFFSFLDATKVPEHFTGAFDALISAAHSQLRIRGIFESSVLRFGTPEAGGWRHFWADNPRVYQRTTLSAGQKMAEHQHNFETLQRALNEIPPQVFAQVAYLMQGNVIKRAAKFLALAEQYAALAPVKDHVRLWHALANGPAGFASIKSSALGSLYDDLTKGLPVKDAVARFNAVTDSRVYMQPTAAPKAGNIDRAEKIFNDLGLSLSLERRVLTRDEVMNQCVWTPDRALPLNIPPAKGIFGNLREDTVVPIDGGAIQLSLRRFMEKVCLTTARMSLRDLGRPVDLGFLTGPVHDSAPPLFAWGHAYSWVRFYGASAKDFGITAKDIGVVGVLDAPSTWTNKAGTPRAVMFLVSHGTPMNLLNQVGSGITSEGLRSDLREVHRTIVAHSRKGTMNSIANAAVGLIVREDDFKPFSLTGMHGSGITCRYDITSWE